MNDEKALKEELETYYYEYGCESSPEVRETCHAVNILLEEVATSWEQFNQLENAVSQSNMRHELNGFLKGYEYCLTMMGVLS